MLGQVILAALVLWASTRLLAILRFFQSTANQPGAQLLLRPFKIFSEMLPSLAPVNQNMTRCWALKYDLFEKYNSSVILYRAALPTPGAQVLVADAEGAKYVFTNKKAFAKPTEDYELLRFFGDSVLTTEGDEWKRHRRLTSPSFSERNNAMVWTESIRVVEEWFAVLDEAKDEDGNSEDVDTVPTTLRLALMIISAAAFGQRSPWPRNGTTDVPKEGRRLGFITALTGATEGTIIKLLFPKWAYKLPIRYPQFINLCYEELEGCMRDMIRERKDEKAGGAEHEDLFSALLSGVNDDEGDGILSTEELLGNMYIFLLAGHETTAHTLAFALTLLALYPEHQDLLHDEAEGVMGGRVSSYDDYTSLPYALATIQEALRMYTPVVFIPKVTLEDTMIPAHTARKGKEGEEVVQERTEVFVKKGTRVGVLASSLHYNPMYWKNPYDFSPSRFIETPTSKWNRDAWVPFSGGSRACLGQKFALVESVAILSHLLLHYSISIPTRLVSAYAKKEGESERERRERIMRPNNAITLTPGKLPLVFKRRSQ